MDLTYEIATEGSGTIPRFNSADVNAWIPRLALNDFVILENHQCSWIQTRCEAPNRYCLEYLDEADNTIYASDPALLDLEDVIRAFRAFSEGQIHLRNHPEFLNLAWLIGPVQPEPITPARKNVAWAKDGAASTLAHANGYQFEEFVATALKGNGWSTRLTKKSGDQGLDVLAFDEQFRVAVQCKRYSSPVGNSAVQEAHAAADFIGATHAVLVATSGFTSSAEQLAEALGVVLIPEGALNDLRAHLTFIVPRPARHTSAKLFRTQ